MLKQKDLFLINRLRKNARTNLSALAKRLGCSLSSLHSRIRRYEEKGFIMKYSSLLRFSELGYPINIVFFIKGKNSEDFLLNNKNVNNLQKSCEDYDYIAECAFKDMNELNTFIEQLKTKRIKIKEFYILEQLKREGFLIN